MNDSQKSLLIQYTWKAPLVLLIAFVLNLIVSKTQSNVGTLTLIVSLLFITALSVETVFFCKLLVHKYLRDVALLRFEVAINQPTTDVDANDYLFESSIITDKKLSQMESKCTCEEIWVVSNDLATEIDGGLYADIVPANLERGIKYKVFVQQNNVTRIRIESLKRKYKNNPNISFYFLTDDFFFLVSRLDFTIYDPYKTSKTGRQGYIGLDLPDNTELYAAKIGDNLVDAIASKLLAYLETPKVVKIENGE